MVKRGRLRRIVSLLLYVGVLAIVFEVFSYVVVVHVFDANLGGKAERHLYSPIRGHQLNPDYRRRGDTDGQLLHSEQGFRRDALVSKAKPEDTFRVIVLGGSTLYGLGTLSSPIYPAHRTLTNSQTIPHYLEVMLDEAFSSDPEAPKIEVINAGVVGYHTFQHVLYIYETLHEFDPDMILFVDGHNDFYNAGVKNPITEYGYSAYHLVDGVNERSPFFSAYLGTRYLGQHSYFFKLVERIAQLLSSKYESAPYNIKADRTVLQRDTAKEITDSAKIGFLRNYKLIESLANLHDFSFHVFLQPEVVFEDMELLSERDQDIADTTREFYGKERVLIMLETRKLLPDLFARYEIPFTEIGEIAAPSESDAALYVDYTHLSPRGSYRVAERMLPIVEDKIRRQISEQSKTPTNADTAPALGTAESGTANRLAQ